MYFTAKLVGLLTEPLVWAGLLLLLALAFGGSRHVAVRRAIAAALLVGVVVGWQAVPDFLLRRLETAFVPPRGDLHSYVGIVVLGGAVDPVRFWREGDRLRVVTSSERITVPLGLLLRYPHLRLLYVGGERTIRSEDGTALPMPQALFAGIGIDAGRVSYEAASRNTHENALLAGGVRGVDKSKPWLLVTSARHMPRAMSEFSEQGWNVTAYPVDHLAGTEASWTSYSLAKGALHWQTALHEYLGLAVRSVLR